MCKPRLVLSWTCRIIAAAVLFQTLFFKFSGAEESVYIFTRVGMEPWGRYGTGAAELIAGILLLVPRTAWAGALLALAIMAGAIVSHLTVLGIVVKDDGGVLFVLAVLVTVCAGMVTFLHRHQNPVLARFLSTQRA